MRINIYHVAVTDIMLYGENDSKVRIVLGDTFISTSDFPEKLENIYGNLRCEYVETKLGNLRNVYGENAIDLDSCNLKNIDSLDEFNGNIHMINSTIDVLEHPKLKSVSLEESTVGSFGKQTHLDRICAEGRETDIKDWGELLSVNDLQLIGKLPSATSLGKIEEANNLSIVNCPNLTTLGNLKKSETIYIHCPTLQDLGDITECDTLSVDNPNIKNKIKKVNKCFYLKDCKGVFPLGDDVEYIAEAHFPALESDPFGNGVGKAYLGTYIMAPGNDIQAVRDRIEIHRKLMIDQERKSIEQQNPYDDNIIDESTNVNPKPIGLRKIAEAIFPQLKDTKGKKNIGRLIEGAKNLFKNNLNR